MVEMTNKILKFVLVISLLMNFSILAVAGYLYCRNSGCRGILSDRATRNRAFLSKKLGLTPDQQKILEEKDITFRKSVREIRDDVIRQRRLLLDLLGKDNPDRDAINAILSEITALEKQTQTLVVDHILEERAVFNREQQAKYSELLKRRCEIERIHEKGGGY
jgi:Spy/CpxP family protein refolding chaperone